MPIVCPRCEMIELSGSSEPSKRDGETVICFVCKMDERNFDAILSLGLIPKPDQLERENRLRELIGVEPYKPGK